MLPKLFYTVPQLEYLRDHKICISKNSITLLVELGTRTKSYTLAALLQPSNQDFTRRHKVDTIEMVVSILLGPFIVRTPYSKVNFWDITFPMQTIL